MNLLQRVVPLFLAAALLLLADAGYAAGPGEKIPVTTSSPVALNHFIEGRTLVDNLRATDGATHLRKAVEIDPSFALAHFYLAQTASTTTDFFANLDKAYELAKHASEAERLWISGFRAGAYGDPTNQRASYAKLADAFPDDEQAQTFFGAVLLAQQEYTEAASHLEKAIAINPAYPPAYNQLGYVYRFLNRFDDAERIFKRYTELIPNDPNPYDSYGELLLKLGRFDESMVQYRKALAANTHFPNSFSGIAANLMYQGKHDAARAELRQALASARTDAEQRGALLATAVTYVDEGKLEKALAELEKQYAVAKKTNDVGAMAGDLTIMGNILLEMGRSGDALARFEKARALIRDSELASEVKANAELIHEYNAARVCLRNSNYADAGAGAERFRNGAEAKKSRAQILLAHELAGMIALAQTDYQKAIDELRLANSQNPYNLYRLALAYQGAGNIRQAQALCINAARFNSLPLMNYAFIRQRAERMLLTF